MIRTFTSMVLFLIASVTIGQTTNTRGVQPKKVTADASEINHALIIGVSDYEDDQIPDLKYAHKDAEAIAAYLSSPDGGNMNAQNITVLLNEQATKANMQAATDLLVQQAQNGDKIVIYFSGHGDVETVTDRQEGFLLTYDSPPNNYIAGAFKVAWMQEIIKKLSIDKGAQVIMISDACRSGSLAGKIDGAQATSAVLAQQFANEVKILSCQPDELSVEGEQWGGGRGCFSYHLIEGLKGLADKNEDRTVNVFEIEQYLENIVPNEVVPLSQIPFTSGNKKAALTKVKTPIVGKARGGQSNTVSQVQQLVALASPTTKAAYKAFQAAIQEDRLLEPKNSSAEYYFNQLIRQSELQPVFDKLTAEYTSALQNEAQRYINLMLKGDPILMDEYVYKRNKSVNRYPEYLAKSAEFLGEKHYMYANLKMKEYFFRGVSIRDQLMTTQQGEEETIALNNEALGYYQKALEMDSTAAFVHLALANIYMDQNDYLASLDFVDKAIAIAPTWSLAKATKGQVFSKMNQKNKAIACYEKALELDPAQVYIMQWLEKDYDQMGNLEKTQFWNQQQTETIQNQYIKNPFSVPSYYKGILAMALSESGNHIEAKKLFTKVIQQTQEKDANLLHAHAVNFYRLNQADTALVWNTKALTLIETPVFWNTHALIQLDVNNPKDAKRALQKAKKLNPNNPQTLWSQGQYHEKIGKQKKAIDNYRNAFELEPSNLSYLKSFINASESDVQTEQEINVLFDWVNRLNPDNASVLKSFALWYKKIGANEKARETLKKALKIKN